MMGESIFIDPIKRWFSSRNNKNVTSTPQGAALTPEQQFAQMRGMLGNAPAPSDAGSGASGAVTAPPNAALQGSKICDHCSQPISEAAKFCPYCANPVTQVAMPAVVPTEPNVAQVTAPTAVSVPPNVTQQPDIGEGDSRPVVQRVSGSATNEDLSVEDQTLPVVERVPEPISDAPAPALEDDESTNVAMADSLRGIFSGRSAINPDTVAFLDRHGTVGTQELLDELKSLQRGLG